MVVGKTRLGTQTLLEILCVKNVDGVLKLPLAQGLTAQWWAIRRLSGNIKLGVISITVKVDSYRPHVEIKMCRA